MSRDSADSDHQTHFRVISLQAQLFDSNNAKEYVTWTNVLRIR